MFDRFTDRAKKVMNLARQEATRFNHEYLGTEHILLGLLREGEGVAAQVLVKLGAGLPQVREQVIQLLEASGEATPAGWIPETEQPVVELSDRVNVSSRGPLEATVGYSRAVRVGAHVVVAGTTTLGPDGVDHPGDCYQQAKLALHYIEDALDRAGASLNDVVRTRAFLTDISRADDYGRAHGEVFGDIRPAATLVEVSALVHPDLVVEIEVDAIISSVRT